MANPKSVKAVREVGDPSLDELSAHERSQVDAEVAELHRLAAENQKAGH